MKEPTEITNISILKILMKYLNLSSQTKIDNYSSTINQKLSDALNRPAPLKKKNRIKAHHISCVYTSI